jgi:hypothetical protein
MNDTEHRDSRRKHRIRRRMVVVAVSVVLLATAARLMLGAAVNSGPVRTSLAEFVEESIGLPAKIGKIRFTLVPSLTATLHGVEVGEGEFRAEADTVRATGALFPLLTRSVRIDRIETDTLRIRTPESPTDLADRIEALIDHINAIPSGSGSAWSVAIDRIQVDAARIERGPTDDQTLHLDLVLTDVVSERIGLVAALDAESLGEDARAEADLAILVPASGPVRLGGTGTVRALHVDRLPIEGAPAGILNAVFAAAPEGAEAWTFDATGTLDSNEHPALAGAFEMRGRRQADSTDFTSVFWEAPGLVVAAEGVLAGDGAAQLHLTQIDISDEALQSLVGMADLGDAVLVASDGASVTGADLRLIRESGASAQFVSGGVETRGLGLALESGENLVRDLHIQLALDDGTIRIERCTAEGLDVSGTIVPDFAAQRAAVDLRAHAEVRPQWIELAGIEGLHELSGTLAFDRIAGELGGEDVIGDGLEVSGTWRNGRLRYRDESIDEDFSNFEIDFATSGDVVTTRVRGQSSTAGPVSVDGQFEIPGRAWRGSATLDFVPVVHAFVETESGDPLETALAEYPAAPIDIEVGLPSEQEPDIRIRVQREQAPPFDIRATAEREEDEWRLARIEGSGAYPPARLAEEFLTDTHAEGEARWTFQRDPVTRTFAAEIDLADVMLAVGSGVRKAPGQSLHAALSGDAGPTWRLNAIDLRALDQTFPLRFAEDRLHFDRRAIDLASLNDVLTTDAKVSGNIEVAFATNPLDVEIEFDSVRIDAAEGADLENLAGRIEYADGRLIADNVAIRTAGSDCRIDATHHGDRWEGSIRGETLDLNAVERAIASIRALLPAGDESAQVEESKPLVLAQDATPGQFTVDIGRVLFRRATLSQVRASVESDADGIRVHGINIVPYSGSITGVIDIVPGQNREAVMQMTLQADQAETRFLDELIYTESRKLYGPANARIEFNAPLYDDYRAVLARGGGRLTVDAANGSLGEFGIATDIMRVLRTTRVISLKAPKLREQGLIYDTLKVAANMDAGLVTFETLDVDGGSYFIQGEGTIDFARDTMDVLLLTRVLESVGSVVERIPLLGRSLKRLTTDIIAVTVGITGSPYDPKVSALGETGAGLITGVFRAVEDAVTPNRE